MSIRDYDPKHDPPRGPEWWSERAGLSKRNSTMTVTGRVLQVYRQVCLWGLSDGTIVAL